MFANERYERILSEIDRKGSVTVKELMKKYKISVETVRRDLIFLENQNSLRRVHGGAVAVELMKPFKKFDQRLNENIDKKYQLSKKAVSFLRDDDIIAIDSGTTAHEFAAVLKERRIKLKIVTNSLDVFNILKPVEAFEIILAGGSYYESESSFFGMFTLDMIKKMRFSKAFIFPSAVSLKHGVSDFIEELAQVQRAYIENSEEIYILADSSKYEINAFLHLCDVTPFYSFVTDGGLDTEIQEMYCKKNIKLFMG